MIEIIAFVWLGALALSLPITFLNLRSVLLATRDPKYLTLQSNLRKVGMLWSLSSESFLTLEQSSLENEERKAFRSYALIGGLGLLSAVGLLFLILVTVSMRRLVSRSTKAVFTSSLARDSSLLPEQVQALVESFKAMR